MAIAGPNLPASGTDDASYGSATWTNPGNITADDGSPAWFQTGVGNFTHYLVGTDFGFGIPSGATIDGIEAVIERRESSFGTINTDQRVRIVKGGSIGSTDKADASFWPTTYTKATYGGPSDLWGETWTPADINANDFGLALSALAAAGSFFPGDVDIFEITVYYTDAGGGSLGEEGLTFQRVTRW